MCLRYLGKIAPTGRGIIVSKVFDRCLPSMQEFEKDVLPRACPLRRLRDKGGREFDFSKFLASR